jgi:hypothetical protein
MSYKLLSKRSIDTELILVTFDDCQGDHVTPRLEQIWEEIKKHNLPFEPIQSDQGSGFMAIKDEFVATVFCIEFWEFASLFRSVTRRPINFDDIYDWPFLNPVTDYHKCLMARCWSASQFKDMWDEAKATYERLKDTRLDIFKFLKTENKFLCWTKDVNYEHDQHIVMHLTCNNRRGMDWGRADLVIAPYQGKYTSVGCLYAGEHGLFEIPVLNTIQEMVDIYTGSDHQYFIRRESMLKIARDLEEGNSPAETLEAFLSTKNELIAQLESGEISIDTYRKSYVELVSSIHEKHWSKIKAYNITYIPFCLELREGVMP